MCVALEEIHVQIYQMTEMGVLNKERCEATGSNPSGNFIGNLEAIVKCNGYKPASQWQAHSGVLVPNLVVTKEVKNWILQSSDL